MKKIVALSLALSFAALLSMAVTAQARRGDDVVPPGVPPGAECQVEAGILVCK